MEKQNVELLKALMVIENLDTTNIESLAQSISKFHAQMIGTFNENSKSMEKIIQFLYQYYLYNRCLSTITFQLLAKELNETAGLNIDIEKLQTEATALADKKLIDIKDSIFEYFSAAKKVNDIFKDGPT